MVSSLSRTTAAPRNNIYLCRLTTFSPPVCCNHRARPSCVVAPRLRRALCALLDERRSEH